MALSKAFKMVTKAGFINCFPKKTLNPKNFYAVAKCKQKSRN